MPIDLQIGKAGDQGIVGLHTRVPAGADGADVRGDLLEQSLAAAGFVQPVHGEGGVAAVLDQGHHRSGHQQCRLGH